MAVEEAEGVAQFVDGFLEEALLEEYRIVGQAVKLVIQAVRTDNGTLAV